MARDWSELFITEGREDAREGAAGAVQGRAGEPGSESSPIGRRGLLRRLRESMPSYDAKRIRARAEEFSAERFRKEFRLFLERVVS